MGKHLEQARYQDAQRLGNPSIRRRFYLHYRIAKAKRENPRIPQLNETPKPDELLEHQMSKQPRGADKNGESLGGYEK